MNVIFAKYLEAGIFGSVIILLILLLRLCLCRAPRRILCLLWILAAVRLVLPFQLESRLSLQPDLDHVAVVIEQTQETPVVVPAVPEVPASHPADDTAQHTQLQPITDTPVQQAKVPVDIMTVLSFVWGSVACAAVIYMLVSYAMLKLRMRDAVCVADGIMQSDKISGAFLLGYFRPKIYLPFHVNSTDRKFIVAHEQAHIARGDNWWKLLGFLCASIHWYSPLVWLAYVLLCRDIELACDERVIRYLNLNDRKGYSMALLNCGKRLAGVSVCPVAFGEVSLKTRIKSILRYRKPGLWITVITFVLITATAICFLTSPVAEALQVEAPEKETEPIETEQTIETTVPETEPPTVLQTEPETTTHVHSYTIQTVATTCTTDGYDLHSCTCGEQFRDNTVSSLGHRYRKVAISGIYGRYVCENCSDEYWEEEVPSNTSQGSVESQLTTYAASFGFDIDFAGSKVSARRFEYTFSSFADKEMLLDAGRSLIKDAYRYCLDNGLDISKQMCCVIVNRPSYPVDLTDPGIGQFSSSSWQRYSIYVYILPRVQLTVPDAQQIVDHVTNNEQTENAKPLQPTEPPVEVSVPETTEPEETVPVTEEEQTEHAETAAPTLEEELLPLE